MCTTGLLKARQSSTVLVQVSCRMGDTVSLAKDRHVSVRGFSVVCDDCGAVFYISHEIVCGRENKKRCSRLCEILARSEYCVYIIMHPSIHRNSYAIGAVQL